MKNRSAPAQGLALALYALILPIVAIWQWFSANSSSHPTIIRLVVVTLILLWLLFLWQLKSALRNIRRGLVVPGSGYQWLATALVALLPILGSQQHRHAPATHSSVSWPSPELRSSNFAVAPWVNLAPFALAAKRVSDSLREQPSVDPNLVITQLQQRDPATEAHILAAIGKGRDGYVTIDSAPPETASPPRNFSPIAAYIASASTDSLTISFVKNGGVLQIPSSWTLGDLEQSIVALHDGRLVITSSEHELLRALALTSRGKTLILHLTTPDRVDSELADLCATLSHPLISSGVVGDISPRVHLLQANPDIENLVHPLEPSLRRRIIEMASYLTLHPGEPVTGERLRSRVLVHAGVDASARVLANVASALRRSLGSDGSGNRLHSVSAAGLYQAHGLRSDIQDFHRLINVARSSVGLNQEQPLRSALELVLSEPLSSSLRGFEWFIAEGHQAKLSRDGEWAALALSDLALRNGDVELAFWAIRQGLLLDPYSDELAEALTAIPRLREFRRDRAGTAQHQTVGASGAIAVRWALTSLTQQVPQ